MEKLTFVLGVAFWAGACLLDVHAAQGPLPHRQKTCVYFGWDTQEATVQDIYRNREKFAETGFDGICMSVNYPVKGGKFKGRLVMASHPFTRAEFEPVIPMLKELLTLKGLSGSYMMLYWMGTARNRIGWTNDVAWAEFAGNMRFMSALAKEVGFKGIFVDHEDYTGKPLFRWRRDEDPEYRECCVLARRRGIEVAKAMEAGDPEVRIAFDRSMVQVAEALRSQTPHESAALYGDLWYPFLNGFIEGMGPKMVHIEGCESSYGAMTALDYRALIGDCRSLGLVFIEPKLRGKYLAQTEMGFGKYLDSWERKKQTMDYDIPVSLFGAGVHCENMFWVYGEKHSIVDWGKPTHAKADTTPWTEVFPGLGPVLRVSVGDFSGLRAKAAAGELANLVTNPGCKATKGEGDVPAPFCVWTAKKTESPRVVRDAEVGCAAPGSLRTVGGASITFKAGGIKKGDRIYATFVAKGPGTSANIVWVAKGAWQWYKDYQNLSKPVEVLANGWKRYECAMIAPEDVDGVGCILSSWATEEKPAWFDDISIYRW